MVSVSIYRRHLDDIPKQYVLLNLLRPPIYVIELSNNQIIAVCYYKDGSSKRYQINAEFSNRRMVIADFNKFSAVLAELLKKFPRHFLWMSAIAATDVTQKLTDGLTDIEIKVIREAIWVSARQAKRSVVSTTVGYQGQVVSR
ncbi:hypothetical protein [Psychrobacter celer]|uniref:hypothetical protein n=1 Tax=Psychrobacter celer TaxID=306572 RepID=UPI003FB98A7D